jgi:hypothetical protein
MKKVSRSFIVGLIITGALILFQAMPVCAASASAFAARHGNQAGTNFYLLHNGTADTFWPGSETTKPANVNSGARILHTTIKTTDRQDLLIGISLQSGIYTAAGGNGKKGSTRQAGPMAAIELHVKIDGQPADPATVIFAKHAQELTAELGGVIQTCTPACNTELTYDDAGSLSGTVTTCKESIIVKDCVVTDEEIGLLLSTTSANHFNFFAPDREAGDHTIEVYAKALSRAEFINISAQIQVFDGKGNITGYATGEGRTGIIARASALVKLGALTLEEVGAADNSAAESNTNACDPAVEFCR